MQHKSGEFRLIGFEVKVMASVRIAVDKSVIFEKVHYIFECPVAESARHSV